MLRRHLISVARAGRRMMSTEYMGARPPGQLGEKGINQVTLLGRVGNDAVMRGNQDHPVCIFSLATSKFIPKRSPDGGEEPVFEQNTAWHRIAVFRPYLRDRCSDTVRKGDKVFVSGSIQYTQYANDEGHTVNSTSIVADEVLVVKKRAQGYDEETENVLQ